MMLSDAEKLLRLKTKRGYWIHWGKLKNAMECKWLSGLEKVVI